MMQLTHLHVGVRDLPRAKRWFQDILTCEPSLATPKLASFALGAVAVVLEAADDDLPITLAITAQSCDATHAELVRRGATSMTAPSDKPWGVRSAYLQGPGRITLEIEEASAVSNAPASL